MIILWTIVALAGLLIVLGVYAMFHKGVGFSKKPKSHHRVRPDLRSIERMQQKKLPYPGAQSREVDEIPAASIELFDNTVANIDTYMKDGIARIFSVEPGSSGNVRELLTIDKVPDAVRQQVLSQIGDLKDFNAVRQLQSIMGDSKTTMAEITRLITSNPILSAKVLQIANSPYYGIQMKLNSISHAIMIIGMTNLKAIIYHEGILKVLGEKSFRDKPAMRTIWQHVNYTSIYASYMQYLFGFLNMGNLFTLGLLHDIGKFVMMRLEPIRHSGDGLSENYSPSWTTEAEEDMYGINHAIVGRLAMQHWGFSPLLVEMVTLHHAPVCLSPCDLGLDRERLQYLLALFLADQAARLFAGASKEDAPIDCLHPTYHDLVDQNIFSRLMADKSLLTQLREAEAVTGIYA